jgi:hypothetical protein
MSPEELQLPSQGDRLERLFTSESVWGWKLVVCIDPKSGRWGGRSYMRQPLQSKP